VIDELSYDRFHANLDRLYRVETSFFNTATGADGAMNANGWGVGNALKNYPEVEAVLYSKGASFMTINHNGKRMKEELHFASPEFLTMFSFPLVSGNPEKALIDPYTIVLTEKTAKKYFKEGDALNKTLTIGDSLQFLVTGILKDLPANSHIQVDGVISFATYTTMFPFDYNGGWGNINVRNYILIKEGTDVSQLSAKAHNIYMERAGEAMKNWGVEAYVKLAPMSDLYLTAKNGNTWGPLGSMERIYLLSGIAVFVIILACINFINLTTARSVYRGKEVGLRKVVGSTRFSIITQFLSESFVLVIIAFIVSLAFAGLLFPLFNQLVAKQYSFNSLLHPAIIGGMVMLIIVISVLSGYYPAWVISAMRPAEVLKGRMQSGFKGVHLRRSLVIFQFFISVVLVCGTLVVINQLRYMQKQSLGFDKEQVIVVNASGAKSSYGHNAFVNELRRLSIIDNITYANALPGTPGWLGQVSYVEGKPADESISVEYMAIDDQYIKTLGLEIIAGSDFSTDRLTEAEDGLILNETAVKMYGWKSPEEAIGKRIASPSGYPAGKVIGVVKDYHQFGLQQHIGPMAMDYNARSSYLFAIRYKAANTSDLIATLGDAWKKHYDGYDFNYYFLDDDFAKEYQTEERLATVLAIFAVITIIIASIGLLGLVSFMVVAKTKEIGIRKVLGANVLSVTMLLSKEFITLVMAGTLLAFPLVWYFGQQWLAAFANKAPLNPMLFVVTFVIAVAISFITISFQTIRAAMSDPVDTLRYE